MKNRITCCQHKDENGECNYKGNIINGVEYFTKGLCKFHYQRLYMYGDVDYQEIIRDGRASEIHWHRYSDMVARCTSPKHKSYKNYGGRGITVQPEWLDKKNGCWLYYKYIEENLGPKPSDKHSIDRINNDLGYVIGNLRWADRHTQQSNIRSNQKDVGVNKDRDFFRASIIYNGKCYKKYFKIENYKQAVLCRKTLENVLLHNNATQEELEYFNRNFNK